MTYFFPWPQRTWYCTFTLVLIDPIVPVVVPVVRPVALDGVGNPPSHKDRGDSMKSWEIIADNLSRAGWTWGCVATVDREGRTIFVADAHRGDGKRFVVHADEKLTAFLELERAICLHLLTEQI
jgi:hypothetical protein